jgi:hypothetical protein
MNEIQTAILALLPANRKNTPSGWTSFNAVCCHHRGEKHDDRKRGGIMTTGDGFTYHCFNCGFKAGWTPGKLLSANTKQLFRWVGMSESDVGKLGLVALRLQDGQVDLKRSLNFTLEEKELPEGTMSVIEWLTTAYLPDIADDIGKIVEYILGRGMELDWYNWMWSPSAGYADRVMIPFYQDGKIVGYTGRKIKPGKPKYLTESQSGYVFNIDRQQDWNRKYVVVVEGQFDAIAIDGVAIMTNEPNDTQIARINALGKEVIVVPDRDNPGSKMIKSALANKWSVSLPPWNDNIKDVADAVKQYGRLYTLFTILHYRESNEIKIQLLKKKLEKIKHE